MSLALADEPAERKVHLIQGEHRIGDAPELMFTTLLGSCVAACLRDPVAGVGGMNHFLLPGGEGHDAMRYGVHAMELLVNALLKRGARRERLEAKLFGGARLSSHLIDVGDQNAAFAERFLRDEGIRYAGGSLRGDQARRVQYWPVSGRARQVLLSRAEGAALAPERRVVAPAPPADGGLELF
ncbi:MAG TPA: chemotaxis protein CheD [Caulobacteraceae bacterium]|jgi:chemotaxis protein CheD